MNKNEKKLYDMVKNLNDRLSIVRADPRSGKRYALIYWVPSKKEHYRISSYYSLEGLKGFLDAFMEMKYFKKLISGKGLTKEEFYRNHYGFVPNSVESENPHEYFRSYVINGDIKTQGDYKNFYC